MPLTVVLRYTYAVLSHHSKKRQMLYDSGLDDSPVPTTIVPKYLNYPLSRTGFLGHRIITTKTGDSILLIIIEVIPLPTQQLEIFEWLRSKHGLTVEKYMFIKREDPVVGFIEPSEYIY